jgi:hypothetical protein
MINYNSEEQGDFFPVPLHSLILISNLEISGHTHGEDIPFPVVKRQRREADHSPPTSAEVKKM